MLTGRGRFLADTARGCVHACFVRSTQAHARVRSVKTGSAAALPGVLAVLTAEDLGLDGAHLPMLHEPHPGFAEVTRFAMSDPRLPILASVRVHYVGQPIAVVVAESRHVAEDAAELVEVEYETLPPVLDPTAALAPDAPTLHAHLPTNEAARIEVGFGDVDEARRAAAVTVSDTLRIGRHGAVPLECRGVVARVDDRRDRVEVWTSTQIPHLVQQALCRVTGWARDEVRVAVPDVGGGFGTKANVYAEEVVVPVAARKLGRDIAWVEDRQEYLMSAAQGRDQVHHATLAVDANGRVLSWEDDFVVDVGASSLWTAGIIANTAIHLMGPYRVPAMRVTGRAAYTNKTIVAQYRGAGRPEACFALERCLDAAARRLGMSPEEIRRVNLLTADDLPYPRPIPYRDGVPISYDGRDYRACFDSCLEMLPRTVCDELRENYPEHDLGYGVATYMEATGRGPYETGRVRLLPSGRFEVATGAASAGQGHETTFAQVAADALRVSPDRIRVGNGDTDPVTYGVGTFASRSAVLAGSAVHLAATRLADRACGYAAMLLDTDAAGVVLGAGGFRADDGRVVDWTDLAAAFGPGGRLEGQPSLDELAQFRPQTVTWTMGVHAVVVGVHRDTGLTSVLRYAVAHEGGAEINPRIVEGQVIGGVAQGIGGALLEEFRYSPEGQPTSTTFADYLLPGMCEVPQIAVKHLYVPTAGNPIGVRGAGESGAIAAYAAIAAAVDDAVGGGDWRVTSVPIAPEQVRAAIARRSAAVAS
nr:xanthine dehydrogenase family protein molybdopterin-binding subunit [Planosporangium thailandense]